jgi:hypothetical protein
MAASITDRRQIGVIIKTVIFANFRGGFQASVRAGYGFEGTKSDTISGGGGILKDREDNRGDGDANHPGD